MMTITKFMTAIALIMIFGACTQKTQEAVTSNQPREERRQRDGGKRGGPPEFSQLLAKMDANQDGQLSASEVEGRLKNNFTKIDTDGDGFITELEMKNAPKPERRRGGIKN